MNTQKLIISEEIIKKFILLRKEKKNYRKIDDYILNMYYEHCKTNNYVISLEDIIEFIENRFNRKFNEVKNSTILHYRALLNKLYYYMKDNKYVLVTVKQNKLSIPICYIELFNNFINDIYDKFDKSTIANKKVFLKCFLTYLDNNKIKKINNVSKNNIYNFLLSLNNYSIAYKVKITYFIREFCEWLYKNKLIVFSGYEVLPLIKGPKQETIPTTYTSEELKLLLSNVDTSTKIGKRDYLILCLLIFYGLRISDIINLKYSNFDLNNNKIMLTQIKTRKRLELSLIEEVKYALLDYLKNSRISCNLEYIFVTYKNPIRKYDKKGLRDIPTKYFIKSNIDIETKKQRPHSLRHSLARNMLSNGIGINEISNILGHSNLYTTSMYLTIHEMQLKRLSLEVPLC